MSLYLKEINASSPIHITCQLAKVQGRCIQITIVSQDEAWKSLAEYSKHLNKDFLATSDIHLEGKKSQALLKKDGKESEPLVHQ